VPDNFITNNYNLFRNDRKDRSGGGVLIGHLPIYNSFPLILNLNLSVIECIFVKSFINNEMFIFGSIYICPQKIDQCLNEFQLILTELEHYFSSHHLIIGGDFNINMLEHGNRNTIKFNSIISNFGLTQLVKEYTYPASPLMICQKSLIDLLIVNDNDIIENVKVKENISPFCDHFSVHANILIENFYMKNENTKPKILDINDSDLNKFANELEAINWNDIIRLDNNTISDVYKSIADNVSQKIKSNFKYKKTKHFKKRVSNLVKRLLIKKRKLFMKFKKNNNIVSYKKYINVYNNIGNQLKNEREAYLQKLILKNNDYTQLYKFIKNNCKESKTKIFVTNTGEILNNDNIICEAFSTYFNSNYGTKTYPLYSNNNANIRIELEDPLFTMTDVLREILKINVNKSDGPSIIPSILIKKCSAIFSKIFYKFFKLIVHCGEIPENLKIATVTPIPKFGKPKNKIESYRGVSVTNNIFKLFETLLLNNLNAHIAYNRLIPCTQYGFKSGISTETQLTDLIIQLSETFNDTSVMCIDVIFLDFSNAFDTVPHGNLLEKLCNYGIKGQFLKLMESLLNNRQQYVKFNNVNSKIVSVNSGVPQGGKASPILFNLYISDLIAIINNSFVYQFADDTILLKIIKNDGDAFLLQNDLNNLFLWCNDNCIQLNPLKSVHMRISFKNVNPFQYVINNVSIETKDMHKHLGVYIDSKLNFNFNTEYIVNQSLKKWTILKRICNPLSLKTFLQLYKSYILPKIEYCTSAIVLSKTQSDKIESIQRKITRDICYKTNFRDQSYCDRLLYLKLDSLEMRRKIKILKTIFMLKYEKVNHLYHLKSRYNFVNTRNGCKIEKPFSRTNICDKNFLIHSIDLFNNLPIDARNEYKLSMFISKCKAFLINQIVYN